MQLDNPKPNYVILFVFSEKEGGWNQTDLVRSLTENMYDKHYGFFSTCGWSKHYLMKQAS